VAAKLFYLPRNVTLKKGAHFQRFITTHIVII